MRISRRVLFSGVLVAFFGQVGLGWLPASQCDCQGSHQRSECDCQSCCDSGLLDVVDAALGRLHKQLKRTTRSFHAELGIGGWKSIGTCDDSCDGDCQQGCDSLFSAKLGVQRGKASSCESCQKCGTDVRSQADDSIGLQSVPPPELGSSNSSRPIVRSKTELKTPRTQGAASAGQQSPNSSEESQTITPGNTPPQRLPDALEDPFQDEASSDPAFKGASRAGERTIHGRAIQYRRNSSSSVQSRQDTSPTPVPNYRQRFDPQANNTAASADYWAGADETPLNKTSEVATASDHAPTLSQIHKRAYSLKLEDQNATSGIDGLWETKTHGADNSQTPLRLPPNADATQPLKAPVPPVFRLKAQPATAAQREPSPYLNPLR